MRQLPNVGVNLAPRIVRVVPTTAIGKSVPPKTIVVALGVEVVLRWTEATTAIHDRASLEVLILAPGSSPCVLHGPIFVAGWPCRAPTEDLHGMHAEARDGVGVLSLVDAIPVVQELGEHRELGDDGTVHQDGRLHRPLADDDVGGVTPGHAAEQTRLIGGLDEAGVPGGGADLAAGTHWRAGPQQTLLGGSQ